MSRDMNDEVKQANVILHNAIARDYESDASTIDLFKPYTQARIAEVLSHISNITEAEVLLDLGCGTGNLMMIGKNYFRKVIGIDISTEMLAIAHSRGLDVFCADINHTTLPDETADCAACFAVLHHLYNPKLLFGEVYRLLKTGGFFYCDYDPNMTSKLLQDTWLFSVGKTIFRKLFCKRKENAELLDLTHIQELAEYHQNIEPGLDPLILKAQLRELGFSKITVIHHSNCSSIKKNSFWHIPIISKVEMVVKLAVSRKWSYSYLASQFLIIAEK